MPSQQVLTNPLKVLGETEWEGRQERRRGEGGRDGGRKERKRSGGGVCGGDAW